MESSVEVSDVSEELRECDYILRKEEQKRALGRGGFQLFECLTLTVQSILHRLERDDEQENIHHLTKSDAIQTAVADLLIKHFQVFKSVLSLLVENIPEEAPMGTSNQSERTEKNLDSFYQEMTSKCRRGHNYNDCIHLCLYAAATCLNTPIYILKKNEVGQIQWTYFQSLLVYEGQPINVIPYVTMYMSSQGRFFKIESTDQTPDRPRALGVVGMYLDFLEDTPSSDVSVPEELLRLPKSLIENLCYTVTGDIVQECCEQFNKRGLIHDDLYTKMTAHRANRAEFHRLVTNVDDAYLIVCQVLIRRRERTLLTPYVKDWGVFVKTCEYLAQLDALVALDTAIYNRNRTVSSFVNTCLSGGRELDERRKKVNAAVIAGSSIGIVSGGLIIAGIVLAPVSFGASLGLTIAGGAIGVGTGVASGSARVVEAVKQNTKLKDVKEQLVHLGNQENNVATALETVETLFKRRSVMKYGREEEGPGISLRGFLAVGSALRASHSVAGIAVAAVRVSTSAAAVAAGILGPLSLVFDIAFLAEAAHNKRKGDKTNAGEMLQTMAAIIEVKCKIFNGTLRGNTEELKQLFEWD